MGRNSQPPVLLDDPGQIRAPHLDGEQAIKTLGNALAQVPFSSKLLQVAESVTAWFLQAGKSAPTFPCGPLLWAGGNQALNLVRWSLKGATAMTRGRDAQVDSVDTNKFSSRSI